MAGRTHLFQQLPWAGGLNTSVDESVIPPNQLTVADNVIFDTRGSRKKREGINHNWDSASAGSTSIIGLHDFWFGATTRAQRLIGVASDGKVYSYNSGTRTQLTNIGTAWTGTLTSCSMLTYGNKVFIAVSGSANNLKYWDGSGSLADAYSAYTNVSISRASSGTTRTLIFGQAFQGTNGGTVVVTGAGNSAYNGTFTVTGVSTTTVANDTITYTGTSSLTEGTAADTAITVGALAPRASILREYVGRIICNDKSNPDLLNYSPTGDPTLWGGYGDSGALPIGEGDGDPIGITAIFPAFKGALFVAKKTKLYKIEGAAPEELIVEKVSDGIGCVSHNSIAPIDQEDIFFVSEKGVHSLNATQAYGDFSSQYVSVDIQKTFNDSFNRSRLSQVWSGYLPNINSVAFTFSASGSTSNDQLYLYHIPGKAWYRWTTVSCESMCVSNDADKRRFYIGTSTTRVSKTFSGAHYDVSSAGANTAIAFRLTTGQIFPDQNAYTMKGLKRFILFYKPTGTHTLAVNVLVDNHALNAENSVNFSQTGGVDLIGSTFVVGTSVVGASVVLGPFVRHVDGFGRGFKIDIRQDGIDEAVEIQGFALEWEPAGTPSEIFFT